MPDDPMTELVAISEELGLYDDPPVRPALIEWEPRSRQGDNAWSSDWPDLLWLLTPDEFNRLPDGTVVTSIHHERRTKGVGLPVDDDTRFGMMAWGLLDSQMPPRPSP